ncbi:hemerythrin family protein [bacterium]|nr:hemerythrin family protein [bacterium]
MSFINWESEKYSVSNDVMDKQHMQLVDMINQFHDFLNQGESKDALKIILGKLRTYADTHFKAEEGLLGKYEYPEAESHKKLHEYYITRLGEFEKAMEKAPCTSDVMFFMKDWLLEHIEKEDKKYSEFLKTK